MTQTPLVVVLSMERSGTSALAECLSRLGYQLSADEYLMGGKPGNPRGFFEDLRPFKLNKDILDAHGATTVTPWPIFHQAPRPEEIERVQKMWQRLHNEGVTLLKDPKYCVLLPWWQLAWPANTVYVIIGRHPVEVARSMDARSDLPERHGLLMWHAYMERAFMYTEGKPRVYVEHDALLSDPDGVMRRVARDLHAITGVPVPEPFPEMPIVPELRHEVATGPAPLPAVQAFWVLMQEVLSGDPRNPVMAPLFGEAELQQTLLLFSSNYQRYLKAQMANRRLRRERADSTGNAPKNHGRRKRQ